MEIGQAERKVEKIDLVIFHDPAFVNGRSHMGFENNNSNHYYFY